MSIIIIIFILKNLGSGGPVELLIDLVSPNGPMEGKVLLSDEVEGYYSWVYHALYIIHASLMYLFAETSTFQKNGGVGVFWLTHRRGMVSCKMYTNFTILHCTRSARKLWALFDSHCWLTLLTHILRHILTHILCLLLLCLFTEPALHITNTPTQCVHTKILGGFTSPHAPA